MISEFLFITSLTFLANRVLSVHNKPNSLIAIPFASPEAVNTTIEVDLTLYDGSVQSDIIPIVQQALEEFRDGRRKLLGQDVVVNQIIKLCIVDGVYDTVVTSPATDLIITETQFANITDIIVNVTGTNPG